MQAKAAYASMHMPHLTPVVHPRPQAKCSPSRAVGRAFRAWLRALSAPTFPLAFPCLAPAAGLRCWRRQSEALAQKSTSADGDETRSPLEVSGCRPRQASAPYAPLAAASCRSQLRTLLALRMPDAPLHSLSPAVDRARRPA